MGEEVPLPGRPLCWPALWGKVSKRAAGGSTTRLGLMIVLVTALVAVLTPTAAEAKACGTIRVFGNYYVVGGAKQTCDFMRRWSRSLIKRQGGPAGWDCHRRRSSGGCTRHTGARIEPFFVYYPPD